MVDGLSVVTVEAESADPDPDRLRVTAYAVAARTVQHCSSQAMFSGAIISAPRWSVVGLTGNATACSRGSSSRPPPDVAAETIEITSTDT